MLWRTCAINPRYEVSDQGEVRNSKTKRVRKQTKVFRGYLAVMLFTGPTSRDYKGHFVHALIAETFIGPRPSNKQINHKNGVKTDNRVSNLEYMTQRQNMRHVYDTGMKFRGLRLSALQVVRIRWFLQNGLRTSLIAAAFNTSPATINRIRTRVIWDHAEMAMDRIGRYA